MKTVFAALALLLLTGCNMPEPTVPKGIVSAGDRFQAFTVPEYNLVCVSGGTGQLSCVKM